jgi:hypothetical protein
LGLLSQRRTWFDSFDSDNPGVDGCNLRFAEVAKRHVTKSDALSTNIRDEGLMLGRSNPSQGGKIGSETRFIYMKKYICLLAVVALFTACEQKQTTVTSPPTEKKETNTTVINPSPATTTKKEKTEININTSPSPH